MILSLWRYSHLALAVSSFLFILVAALTGIVLAFEPVQHAALDHDVVNASSLPVSQVIDTLKSTYDEVLSLEVDEAGFVQASVLSMDGDSGDFYIDPLSGKKLGEIPKQAEIYQFATSLHRSLFLKGIGRFFVGLASFLLFLISVTGLILIIKRQQGIRAFFDKIIKDNFYSYWHIYLGRLSLIPIIIITLTGVYLSLQRFEIVPNVLIDHDYDFGQLAETPERQLADFPALQNIMLDDVRSIEFPFSFDVEDPYKIRLTDKEILVNQYTGEIISEVNYPLINILSHYSTVLHTGRGSVLWAIILAAACISILFFIYSGFKMTFMRRKGRIKNKYKATNSEIVILVGSETGSTMAFASLFCKALIKEGKKVFVTQMDKYQAFAKMEQLIIFTSTYGDGEPPANAKKFISRLKATDPAKSYKYSVVGFGSLAYPSYCKFAFEVDDSLRSSGNAAEFLKPYTINNKSWEAFDQWVDQWSEKMGIHVDVPRENDATKPRKTPKKFKVLSKTTAQESADDTFLISLKAEKKTKFKSGDLLAIYPHMETHERLYSIGKDADGEILLSIKRHEFGLCSNYLNDIKVGDSIDAVKVKNPEFHLKSSQNAIMIATGTGIAPFLGMIQDNEQRKNISLYWGGRNEESFALYKNRIEDFQASGKLQNFIPAYSRVGAEKIYVQHLIARDGALFAEALKKGSILLICGSISMQREVIDALTKICEENGLKPLSHYQKRGQVKMDCY